MDKDIIYFSEISFIKSMTGVSIGGSLLSSDYAHKVLLMVVSTISDRQNTWQAILEYYELPCFTCGTNGNLWWDKDIIFNWKFIYIKSMTDFRL